MQFRAQSDWRNLTKSGLSRKARATCYRSAQGPEPNQRQEEEASQEDAGREGRRAEEQSTANLHQTARRKQADGAQQAEKLFQVWGLWVKRC